MTRKARMCAYLVHVLTASGVVFAFLATAEVTRAVPDPAMVLLWLWFAAFVDAIDGPLARTFQVKRHVPHIQGRTIDDIVDYLTFTFIPLLLVWKMGWVLEPAGLFVAPAMMASLLGFANVEAKQEQAGFFMGFPSYWNIYMLYAGLWCFTSTPLVPTLILVFLTVLTLLPVRFLYPNLAPRPWRKPLLVGAYVWMATLAAMLPSYPDCPTWLTALSLPYPLFYVGLSCWLDRRLRMNAGPTPE